MNDSSNKKIINQVRLQEHDPVTSYHITTLRVPFFEVDMGQAVYHGNYYHLFQLAREDLMRKSGYPYREFIKRQLHLPIVECRCKYRKPLYYDDEIEVHTKVSSVGRRSVDFTQLIYKAAQDCRESGTGKGIQLELCTEARINLICVTFDGQVAALPQDFRQMLESLVDKKA